MVDTIIVGNFSGEDALSAVGTTGSFTFLFLALVTDFSAGNGVVVAQHYGAGNEKQVRDNASTGILLMLGMDLLSEWQMAEECCYPAFRGDRINLLWVVPIRQDEYDLIRSLDDRTVEALVHINCPVERLVIFNGEGKVSLG